MTHPERLREMAERFARWIGPKGEEAKYKDIAATLRAGADGLDQQQEALRYATELAKNLHTKHYSHVAEWEPLPDLVGVLTQIDNMTAGLIRLY